MPPHHKRRVCHPLLRLLLLLAPSLLSAMPKTVTHTPIPHSQIGTRHTLQFHTYEPQGARPADMKTAYIQASLHADEIPGLLVVNHLLRKLDEADAAGLIRGRIIVVPFANPIGLSQIMLGSHIGRFSFDTATNFNRDWPDYTTKVVESVKGRLTSSAADNVAIIRSEILRCIDEDGSMKVDAMMKKILFREAAVSDMVLDLHCDTEAVMHLYTHDKLWPEMADLAALLQSRTQLLAPVSGGNAFDEACSCLWASVQAAFPESPVPMACQSATIELRGEVDVFDELAEPDAGALFSFLQHRGLIAGGRVALPPLLREATPLSGVDMVEAPVAGVVCWKVRVGDSVSRGQLLGEIVDIERPGAPRTPVLARADGFVFGVRCHKLVRPGHVIIKVSGDRPLDWRSGNLLTL